VGDQIPVAARLERFEWEQGYKCAKIIYEFTGNIPVTLNLGGVQLEKPKSIVRREVYFAYDLGQVIRVKTITQLEGRVRQESFGGGFGAPGGFGGPPGFGRGQGGFGAEDEGAMRGGRGAPRGGPGALGGPGAMSGPGAGAAPGAGARGGFGGGGAQTGARNIINRFSFEIDMKLFRIF
jgi:hypothetical protein